MFLLEAKDKWNSPTPAYILQHASRTAEAAEVSTSFEAVVATLRVFGARTTSISCTKIYFIPVSYSVTSELRSSGHAEATHVGDRTRFTPSYACYFCMLNIIKRN